MAIDLNPKPVFKTKVIGIEKGIQKGETFAVHGAAADELDLLNDLLGEGQRPIKRGDHQVALKRHGGGFDELLGISGIRRLRDDRAGNRRLQFDVGTTLGRDRRRSVRGPTAGPQENEDSREGQKGFG